MRESRDAEGRAGVLADPPLVVAVDLVHLRPGGENGGIRPFLFELVGWLGRQTDAPVRFVFLTNSVTHDDVFRELARLEDTLVCVRVEAGGPPSFTGTGGVPRERLWADPPGDLAARLGADVLYCPFGPTDFACPGLPVVSTVVDLLHRDFPASLPPDDCARRERFFRRLAARADRLQCNTDYVKARMTDCYGVEPERMFHVYNAIHGRFALDAPDADDPAPGAAAAPPYFLYPANTWPHKNHEVLLLGYHLYRQAALGRGETPWDLRLTGHADARLEELRTLADALDLDGHVRFAGYVAAADFGQLWAGAGALVFPSLHEGFGIPLLEAMHHGLPIASSAACSLPEVGADACLYVEEPRSPAAWGDAFRRLADFSLAREGGRLLAVLLELGRGEVPLLADPTPTGVFPDGWTGPEARFALPPAARGRRCRLELATAPMPARRQVVLRCGPAVVGGLRVEPNAPAAAAWTFYPAADALVLRVPDAAGLAPGLDPRVHGVPLGRLHLRLLDAAGEADEGWDLLAPALAALAIVP